jgi:DNA replication protein DnaC
MTKPKKLTMREFFDLCEPERKKYHAELDAWRASPEGIAEKAAEEAMEKARYEALLPAAIREKLQKACVPDRALDVIDNGVQETLALASAKEAREMLVLLGGCGCGKTVAAASWLHKYVSNSAHWQPIRPFLVRGNGNDDLPVPTWCGSSLIWTTSAQLARMDHFDQKAVDRVAKAHRLVIDDLGAEYQDAKGFFGSLLDEIIDARYTHKLPTVITSNLDAASFKARYGVRIVDRIREAGRFVGCGDKSLRRRSAT